MTAARPPESEPSEALSAASQPSGSRRPVVLQVLPELETGGVERSTVEITQAIADAEGVALVASAGGRMVGQVEHAGGRHITLPLDTKNPLAIWRNAARLEAVIRQEQVAIVHARSRGPAWSVWLACRRTGVHFVTTHHGTYSETLPFKRRYNSVMARGEIVIAASHFIAEQIMAQHGVAASRIRVIPRGVDPKRFDPDAVSADRLARLTRAWRLPDGATTVVLPGRLTAWKGHAVLIEALARLVGRDAGHAVPGREVPGRDIVAVLVGSDQGRHRYAAALVRQAQALGVADRLRLVGECDDMPAALKLSDVVVHASTHAEAFGRVVIEAQAMARPVIAADLGGPVETVEHEVTGLRVPPGDAAALAAAIERVLALSPDARLALGAAARASVLRHYTVRAMQEATLDVYEAVLGRGGE
jgi:glycosyltransferase involved in cell wall biosynthesis